jgi:hypothetical protein
LSIIKENSAQLGAIVIMFAVVFSLTLMYQVCNTKLITALVRVERSSNALDRADLEVAFAGLDKEK